MTNYNICQTIYRDILEPAGSPIRAWEISSHLKIENHKVFACSVSNNTRVFEKNGIKIYQYKLINKRPFERSYVFDTVRFSHWIEKACENNQPDLIHAHIFQTAISAYPVKRSYKVPMVYDMHGLVPEEITYKNTIKKLRWFPWYMVAKVLRKYSDFIVATSDSLMEMLINIGIPEDKIESIPVGVNTRLFYPGNKDNHIRKKYSLQEKNVVLFAGCIESYQGIDTLFESIAQIVKQRKDIVFLIVGGGSDLEKYIKIAQNPLFKNQVIMTGQIDYTEMPEYIRAAEIGLSLRTYSLMGHVSFPTKLTTYMACGLPCIATSNGDQKKIINKHGTGFLVKSGDTLGLTKTILEALSDKNRLKEMSKKSRLVAEKEFSWDVLCKKYIRIYDKLIQ